MIFDSNTQSIKNETQKSIKSNHNETQKSIRSNNNNNNETKKSIKSSVKKENNSQTVDDLINSFKDNNGGEEIDINDIIINKSTQSGKISCEFIGKNYARDNYCLTDIPNNVETVLEIKNTGDSILPKGCYLYDENNCRSLMLLDNVINSIEPGKTIYKQLKFDIYIYSKGSYHVKLAVKDHNGAFISTNKFEYTLVVE